MAGLLDSVFGAPGSDQSQAMGLLAAGLVSGRFGDGLASATQVFSPEAQLKRQDLAQQIMLRNIELQRAQQQWESLKPIYDAMGRAYQDQPAQAAPVQPALPSSPGGAMGSGTLGIPTGPDQASAGGYVGGAGGQQQAAPAQPMQPQSSNSGSIFGLPKSMAGPILALGGPAELAKAISSYNAPTEGQKILAAQGILPGDPRYAAGMAALFKKQVNIPLQSGRAGAPMYDSDGNVVAMAPKIPDNAIPQIVNGRIVGVSPLPGGAGITQTNAYALQAGKNQAEPMTAYRGTQPVFTNKFAAAQLGDSQQGNADGSVTLPNGVTLTKDVVDAITGDAMAHGGSAPKFDFQNAPGRSQTTFGLQGPPGGNLSPGLAPGIPESQAALATAGAKRFNDTLTQAADAPMRINVLDNILNLSKQGVQTGPNQEFTNKVKGFIADTPALKQLFPNGWQGSVADYQELKKFMGQNALRQWQAAGGTGTDAQLEASVESNINKGLFPQAIQAIAEWNKGGELALMGKANAMQMWKDQQGGNVANQDQFERAWRNSFDPLLFQLKTMDLARQQQFVSNLKFSNPQAYSALMAKAQSLEQMGGL